MPKDFWKKKWGKDSICPITHTRLRPGNNKHGVPYTICLPCKHRYVRSALIEWAKSSLTNPNCPLCRQKFGLADLASNRN